MVSKYMRRGGKPPSQSWKTFLRNNADAIAAIDLCVVWTLAFDLLFVFIVLGHGRRQLLWLEITQHPSAEWLARQITEAFPWASAPAYLVRDNDRAYGQVFTARIRAMGIRDRPIAPASPWQNGIAERLIGTLRRECLDQMVIFSEPHLRRILSAYVAYYNQTRPHLAKCPTVWQHCRHPRSGRATSPICSDIIFGKDRLDVSLDAHVSENKQRGTDRRFPNCRIRSHKKGDADFGLNAMPRSITSTCMSEVSRSRATPSSTFFA